MTINEITEELKNEDLSPPDLAKLGTILAGFYSYYGHMLKELVGRFQMMQFLFSLRWLVSLSQVVIAPKRTP